MAKVNFVPYLDIYRTHKKLLPELKELFEKVIRSGLVILGPELLDFEKKYAKFCDSSYCVGVANGYDALILSLLAHDIKKGDDTSPRRATRRGIHFLKIHYTYLFAIKS